MAIDYKKVQALHNAIIAELARAQQVALIGGSGSMVRPLKNHLRNLQELSQEFEEETSMAKLMASD